MTNFAVNGVNYNSMNVYAYLGNITSGTRLKEAFRHYNITPHGKVDDLQRLKNAMYTDYTHQVQSMAQNQQTQQTQEPWVALCQKIGLSATGDYQTDKMKFDQELARMQNSYLTPEMMSFVAMLKSEAQVAFALSNNPQAPVQNRPVESFSDFQGKTSFL